MERATATMEASIVDIIQQNDIKAFTTEVIGRVGADVFFEKYFRLLVERGRYAMFSLLIAQSYYSEKIDDEVITLLIRYDRKAMLCATPFFRALQEKPSKGIMMRHICDCFEHDAPLCFGAFNIDNFYGNCEKEEVVLMNLWLYKYAASKLFDLLVQYQLFLRECIMQHICLLDHYNPDFMEKLIYYKPYLWNIATIVIMLENRNLWFIKYVNMHLMSICYKDHFLFDTFKDDAEIIGRLTALCSCQRRWIPPAIAASSADNSERLEELLQQESPEFPGSPLIECAPNDPLLGTPEIYFTE